MKAELHDGTTVEAKVETLRWQDKGLSYTASGYGAKIPTQYKVKHNGRWKRVYVMIWSNSGTSYILDKGRQIIIDSIGED